jgi:hypothetical protein
MSDAKRHDDAPRVISILSVIGIAFIYLLAIIAISVSGAGVASHTSSSQTVSDNTIGQFENLLIIGSLTVQENTSVNENFTSGNETCLALATDALVTKSAMVGTTALTSGAILSMKTKTRFLSIFLTHPLTKSFDFTGSVPNFNPVFPFGNTMTLATSAATGTDAQRFVLESQGSPSFNGAFAEFLDPGVWTMICNLTINWGPNTGLFVTPVSADLIAVAVDESIDCTAAFSRSVLSMSPMSPTQTFYNLENIVFETPVNNASNMLAKFIGLAMPIVYDPVASKSKLGKISITGLNVTFRQLL